MAVKVVGGEASHVLNTSDGEGVDGGSTLFSNSVHGLISHVALYCTQLAYGRILATCTTNSHDGWSTLQPTQTSFITIWTCYHIRRGADSQKEGTMWPSGWIAQIGNRATQISVGELRQMEGYLGNGKIPYIKESLYLHENLILPPL